VTRAADTFAAFVDVLATALDDHEATGESLAARMYLSRYHLDRIVSSVAGEPPRKFRRRVLLERAAYRLVTTREPIIDVALEAGYGSHEAFTRAFAKAYGVGPSGWRRRPSQIRIDAPSEVHFHPPGSLRLPAREQVTSMDLLTRMVEHHIWLVGEMIECASRLEDADLDRQIELSVDEDQQTIRSLLSRLVGQMGMWNSALADRAYDWSIEEHESIDSLRRRLAREGATYLSHVREVGAQGRLDETFVDALCEPAEVFTYGGMIAHVLTFAAHRRTLVVLALDAAGVSDLGWGDPMRWVAQPAT
jgi:AraC-like DNA-binding protein